MGLLQTVIAMGKGLSSERRRGWQLFRRGLKRKFSDSRLGILWDLFDPVFMAVAFILVRSLRGFEATNESLPFAVYCVIGLMLWQNFMDGLNTGMRVITGHSQFLSAIKIKPEALFWTAIFDAGFRTLIRLGICLATLPVLALFGLVPMSFMPGPLGIALFLVMSPILLMMGLGLGFVLSPFAALSSDISRFVPLFARPLMFLSLAIFALPVKWAKFNPIGVWVDSQRSVLSGLDVHLAADLAWSGALAAALFLIGWYILHTSLPIVADPE
ncbi:MAG: hypothetical protein AAGJ85_08870 [Pseudomonadota bacterium]